MKEKLAVLFAHYLDTEGCDCCRVEGHDDIGDEIGRALDMPRYDDDSGIDYGKVLKEVGEG